MLQNIVNQLRSHYRKIFWNDLRLSESDTPAGPSPAAAITPSSTAYRKASAWYFVAYAAQSTPFSFPWLTVGELLIDIFLSKSIDASMKVHPDESVVRDTVNRVQKAEEAFIARGKRRRQQQQQARNKKTNLLESSELQRIAQELRRIKL